MLNGKHSASLWVYALIDRIPHENPNQPKKLIKCTFCELVFAGNITRAKEQLNEKCPKYQKPDKRVKTEQQRR